MMIVFLIAIMILCLWAGLGLGAATMFDLWREGRMPNYRRAKQARRNGCILFAGALILAVIMVTQVHAGEVRIAPNSVRYRLALEHAAGERFGLNAPVARIAAQVQQESDWDPKAESPYAQGLSQFTPATAAWLPSICPSVGPPDPWSADWSIRAVACYDHWLHQRAPGATPCARWAMTLSAYNGGERARNRERALADAAGADPERWFGQTDHFRARSLGAWRENRGYVRRILKLLEPAYLAAGWPGQAVCDA